MKTQSTPLYVLRLSLTLLVITALVALALAGVNAITKDRIAAIKQEKIQQAITEVLPGAECMVTAEFTDATGLVKTVYITTLSSGTSSGYVVEVVPAGFGGDLTMMVGIQDGKVTGISIVSHTETAGLGSVAGDKTSRGEEFRNQFAGLSGVLAVDKDGGVIDSITGATITSRAITAGINAALACQVGGILYG